MTTLSGESLAVVPPFSPPSPPSHTDRGRRQLLSLGGGLTGVAPHPVSSMAAAANQPGALVPALTAPLTAAPEPSPGAGLTSWETHCTQFELATANDWSPAESAVQLVSALEGEARRVLLDVTTANLGDPQGA